MPSAVEICNVALAHLGDPANVASIDPPEGSPQARYCARFYPIARDTVQEAHTWAFNTRRAALASVAMPAAVEGEWLYAYALPADCLRAFAVYIPGQTEKGKTEDYTIESLDSGQRVIFTDAPDAYIRYVVRVVDTTKFTPAFVNALSYLIAKHVAGPLTKDTGKVESMDKLYERAMAKATALDANAQSSEQWKEERSPGWISAR